MIEPTFDRVVVIKEDFEQVSEGGIVIASTKKRDTKENITRGRVVAVGPGRTFDSGHFEPTKIKVDDKVIFDEENTHMIHDLGTDYLILREGQILAVAK